MADFRVFYGHPNNVATVACGSIFRGEGGWGQNFLGVSQAEIDVFKQYQMGDPLGRAEDASFKNARGTLPLRTPLSNPSRLTKTCREIGFR